MLKIQLWTDNVQLPSLLTVGTTEPRRCRRRIAIQNCRKKSWLLTRINGILSEGMSNFVSHMLVVVSTNRFLDYTVSNVLRRDYPPKHVRLIVFENLVIF